MSALFFVRADVLGRNFGSGLAKMNDHAGSTCLFKN